MTNIYIKTYGCSFNHLDSEVLAGILEKNNYNVIENDVEAYLIIINSCTVKNTAETKLFNDIKKYNQQNKKSIPMYAFFKINHRSVIRRFELINDWQPVIRRLQMVCRSLASFFTITSHNRIVDVAMFINTGTSFLRRMRYKVNKHSGQNVTKRQVEVIAC